MLVVERPGLRQCRQEDFLHLKAHWLRALGAVRQAERVQTRAAIEPRQMALHKLHAELARASDVIERPREYVAAISAARFKTSLIETDLAANQIWNLVFDIRRAAQKRRAARRAPLVESGKLNAERPTSHVPPSTSHNADCKEAP